MKILGTIILSAVLFLLLVTGLNYFGYINTAFYAPKYEDIRRTTFEHSRAFNEGMIRDLENLKMEYMGANETQKIGLRAAIIHRFEVYPQETLPADLQTFYNQLLTGEIQ